MENQKVQAKKHILNYGILLGIVSIVLGVIMYVTNSHLEPGVIFAVIGFLILVAVISLAIKAFKKDNGGYLSLGEALKVGVGTAVIGAIISAIWMFVLITFIEPDYMAQVMEIQQEKMLEMNPNMTEAQIQSAMDISAKFSSPWIITAFAILQNLFFGFIIALVAGLVMKKENPYKS